MCAYGPHPAGVESHSLPPFATVPCVRARECVQQVENRRGQRAHLFREPHTHSHCIAYCEWRLRGTAVIVGRSRVWSHASDQRTMGGTHPNSSCGCGRRQLAAVLLMLLLGWLLLLVLHRD